MLFAENIFTTFRRDPMTDFFQVRVPPGKLCEKHIIESEYSFLAL